VASAIPIRRMDFPFADREDPVPKHWLYDLALVSHGANGLNMLFPLGERFFVRSVRRYLDRVEDPALRERVRRFSGQETQHGREHERAFELLEAQGYEIRSWLAWYERWAFGWLERLSPPMLRLSVTVALEHFTATMAELALTDGHLDHAHPVMRDLLRWHAAEEIEHKSVAFDVMRAAGGGYLVRVFGAGMALALLLFFWGSAQRHLLRQEPGWSRARLREELARARGLGLRRERFIERGLLPYLKPGFHPDQTDNGELARAYLAGIGRLHG
jgi:predicted metal-dependent hydrolase